MSRPVALLFGADADLQQLFDDFEEYGEGFGAEFILAVDAHLARLSSFPEMAPSYWRDIRRLIMRRFPFGIFYEATPTRILVIAVLDLRQDEKQILRRLRGDR